MAGRWFSLGTLVSSTNKTDGHDITEILLKVALRTIKLNQTSKKLKFNLRVELKSHMKKSKGNKINTV